MIRVCDKALCSRFEGNVGKSSLSVQKSLMAHKNRQLNDTALVLFVCKKCNSKSVFECLESQLSAVGSKYKTKSE